MSVKMKDFKKIQKKIWKNSGNLKIFEERKYHQIFVRILITIVAIKEENYHQIPNNYENSC